MQPQTFARYPHAPTIVSSERPESKKGIPVAERSPRKLAVILHADVAGSTALVQRDEDNGSQVNGTTPIVGV